MLLALRADQQVVLQLLGFRTGKRLHGISFKRVIGDVRHEFLGTLFLRKMGWAGPVQASCDNTPGSHSPNTVAKPLALFGFAPEYA